MGHGITIPYDERSDDEKLSSSWHKARGHFKREDWSACIIRIATAVEISTNIYIRNYLEGDYDLPNTYVDALLFSANGLFGKFKKLIIPAAIEQGVWNDLKKIQKKLEKINIHRNEVAHMGKFKNKADAINVFKLAEEVVNQLAPNVRVSIP